MIINNIAMSQFSNVSTFSFKGKDNKDDKTNNRNPFVVPEIKLNLPKLNITKPFIPKPLNQDIFELNSHLSNDSDSFAPVKKMDTDNEFANKDSSIQNKNLSEDVDKKETDYDDVEFDDDYDDEEIEDEDYDRTKMTKYEYYSRSEKLGLLVTSLGVLYLLARAIGGVGTCDHYVESMNIPIDDYKRIGLRIWAQDTPYEYWLSEFEKDLKKCDKEVNEHIETWSKAPKSVQKMVGFDAEEQKKYFDDKKDEMKEIYFNVQNALINEEINKAESKKN